MPVSGSSPASGPTSSTSAQRSEGHSRKAPPGEEQRQRDDFQRKLMNREKNADEKGESKQRGTMDKTKSREEASHSAMPGLKPKDEKQESEKLAALGQNQGQPGALADKAQIAGQASATAEIDPALKSQIERIAAAIAEMSAKDVQTKYTLQLPGSSPIESAVLARNAAGFISVLLVARPGALDRYQRRQIRAELDERLKDRAVKLADIGFAGDSSKG